jgi:hypothetical protein
MDIIDQVVKIGRFIIDDEKNPTKLYKVAKNHGKIKVFLTMKLSKN